ncbi:MAG: lasso RiPP family leader peptide-containing protein [Candidatus Binatia bacterium]
MKPEGKPANAEQKKQYSTPEIVEIGSLADVTRSIAAGNIETAITGS